MAAAGSEQKELLALIHQHLVQIGYGKAARELLLQSGQKNFPPSPVLLRDIFTQWKKTSLQSQTQTADDLKRDALAKIRVPDPKSSSESEEEEVAKPIATNLSVNNRSTAMAESSSEDEDSSSEEEAVTKKVVKTPVAGNKTAHYLQLAAQKSNSVPGKGVAVAAVQARSKPNKAVSSKQPLPAVPKTNQQNKVVSGKPGATQAAAAKQASSSESSSSGDSSSVESEEEKTLTVAKAPAPTLALKKADSSSEDSSSDSEEETTNTAAVQVKPAVHSAQINTTSAKSSQVSAVPSKASPARATANQPRAGLGSTAVRTKAAESSETSDSSDSEDENPASVMQAKLLGKTPQAFTSPVKNAPSALLLKKAVHAPTPLKKAARPPASSLRKPGLLSPAKTAGNAKETESSESSSSDSEPSPVPISQKRVQTPQPPTAARQSQADKPGPPQKAALKGKESKSSSSSDSEDETVRATPNLPPPSTTKTDATAVLAVAKKQQQPSLASLQKAQESEDSSEDSSDESEEDTVFTQKLAPVTQKPGIVPAKPPAAKAAGAKVGSVLSAGKGTTSPGKPVAVSLHESSETDSSDSSQSDEEGKQAKQQQPASGNAGKGFQANAAGSDSASRKRQGKGPAVTPGKVVLSPSKQTRLGQAQPAKHAGIPNLRASSGSSSSSDSEEEVAAALTAAKRIAQPAGTLQKQGAIKKAESSSEESSDEDLEPSQSLLTGYPGHLKTPTAAAPTNAASTLSKRTPGKAIATPGVGAFAEASEKAPPGDSSSSDSSDSDTDAETRLSAGQKPAIGSLPSSGREAVVAKRAVGAKPVPGGSGSQVPPAKKARKAQSNGRAKGATAKPCQVPPALLPVVQPEGIGSKCADEAATGVSGAGAQGDLQAAPQAATKAPKAAKASKAGVLEKPQKKRKLATGDAGPGEPKGKKLKVQSGLEVPKKKKKKPKSSSSTNTPPKKEGKEKKSSKNKRLTPLLTGLRLASMLIEFPHPLVSPFSMLCCTPVGFCGIA
ncbi:hypothetical protein lerEdw1_016237 [Lerista edwardsae]|nr:hypothetical protein lerEdw1_016237 [Lerista edwardsae]